MKNRLMILLVLLLILTMLVSCSKQAVKIEEAEQETQMVEEKSDQPIDPLEGLEEDIKHAIELGIADISLVEQLDETANQKVVAQMIKNVDDLYYGEGHSKYLSDIVNISKENIDATRYFAAQNIYYSRYEEIYDIEYTNAYEWFDFCNKNWHDEIEVDAGYLIKNEDGIVKVLYDLQEISDYEEICMSKSPDSIYPLDYGNPDVVIHAIKLHDRKTGKKVLRLNEENKFNPRGTMTVKEAIELSLRYYRSFPKHPVEVKYQDVTSYNKDIITDEMLDKKSDLPDCSSSYLPKEWKGVLIPIMMHTPRRVSCGFVDDILIEKELDVVKEAGFNYITFSVSFSSLQEPFFNEGTVNLSQLEYMDEVLSWCIERDIHMEIRCNTPPGLSEWVEFDYAQEFKDNVFTDEALRQEFAEFWGMLARRYSEIPNKYLSFNLIGEPDVDSDEQYAMGYKPIVEAIKAESADRCIIADITSFYITGKSMAELGVALSCHIYDPRDFCVLYESVEEYEEGYFQAVTWPYVDSKGRTWTVDDCLNEPLGSDKSQLTAMEVKAIADEYGVGYMIGEWGIFGAPPATLLTETYDREVIYDYLEDYISRMEELGIGWALGNAFDREYGITNAYPSVEGCEYVSLEGTNLYKELGMIKFFQDTLK